MEVRKLVILGLLREESQHGYHLNQSIADHYRLVTNRSPSSTYSILASLADAGDVAEQGEQEDPRRKVYQITPQGEQTFLALLREQLASPPPPVFVGAAALPFIDALPPGEAAALLQQCLDSFQTLSEGIAARLERLDQQRHAPNPTYGLEMALEYQLALMHAAEKWLADAVRRMEQKASEG